MTFDVDAANVRVLVRRYRIEALKHPDGKQTMRLYRDLCAHCRRMVAEDRKR